MRYLQPHLRPPNVFTEIVKLARVSACWVAVDDFIGMSSVAVLVAEIGGKARQPPQCTEQLKVCGPCGGRCLA